MKMLMHCGGIAMTNSFLIADEDAKEGVLFDAPDHTTEPLLEKAARQGWKVIGLWLTHGHFDHFADHPVVRNKCPSARFLIHSLEQSKAEQPDLQTRLFGLPFVIPPFKANDYVTDNQQLAIGNLQVTVLHTPGHAPGHVCYYFPEEGLLIGGDLIIGGSVGRTDLPDSDHTQLQHSIKRVMALPPGTKLLGGHGRPTTLQYERDNNPFVQEALEAPWPP
jgi:hydroxyacylglutathione hydrolase